MRYKDKHNSLNLIKIADKSANTKLGFKSGDCKRNRHFIDCHIFEHASKKKNDRESAHFNEVHA